MYVYIYVYLNSGKIHARTATFLNDAQRALLKQSFASETSPSKDKLQKLSEKLGLKVATVYNWFKAERARVKRRKYKNIPQCKFIQVCVSFIDSSIIVFTKLM